MLIVHGQQKVFLQISHSLYSHSSKKISSELCEFPPYSQKEIWNAQINYQALKNVKKKNFHQDDGQWAVCQKISFCPFLSLFLTGGNDWKEIVHYLHNELKELPMILACCHQYAIVCFGTGAQQDRQEGMELSWNFQGTFTELPWWKDASEIAMVGKMHQKMPYGREEHQELTAASSVPITAPVIPRKRRV